MATLERAHQHPVASASELQAHAKDAVAAPPRVTLGRPLFVANPVSQLQESAELQWEDRQAGLAVSLILVSIIALGCLLMIGTVLYCCL